MSTSRSELNSSFAGLDAHEQLAAIWASVRRHPLIVVSSIAAALLLGTLYYLRVPRTYESRTQIRIITKKFSVSGDEKEQTPTIESTIETHKVVITSRMIVERAIHEFNLEKLPTLAGEDDVLKVIRDNLDANVKEDNTTVLELAYRSSREEDCQKVLQAINTTYEKYLDEFDHDNGTFVTHLFTNGKDDLLEELRKTDEEIEKFRNKAPLIWRDGEGVNMHHERQLAIEESRLKLLVQRAELEAQIAAMNEALKKGTVTRDALRYEALKELSLDEKYSDWRSMQIAEQEQFAERAAMREYAALLMGEFVRLEVEISEKSDQFDDGHPELESAMKRKNRVKELLQEMTKDQMALSDNLLGIDAAAKAEEEKKDYVAIYMQLLNARKEVLDQQIQEKNRQYDEEQKLANEMQSYILTDQKLRDTRKNQQTMYDLVLSRLQEVNLLHDAGGDSMTIIEQPQLGEQVAPRILLVALGSLLLGTIVGCSVACSIDSAERTFRSVEEIRDMLDLPVVGCIPTALDHATKQVAMHSQVSPAVFTIHQEGSHQAEAYRSVRTSLYYSTMRQNHKVIQVTSPLPGDGKSTLTANLAVAIAKSGKRVLVVDADFRRPMMAQLFGIAADDRPGLGAVIAGQAELSQAITKTSVENLYLVPARERPRQPSELLTTPQFAAFLQTARKQFDFVLVDSPPLLPVTDPSVIAGQVDGVLLTVRIRKGVRVAALRAVEMLRAVDANVQGIVVNGWDPSHGKSNGPYDYGYAYGYGTHAEDGAVTTTNGHAPIVSHTGTGSR
jgi:polysaccharide biosynthesis transport protein